MALATHIYLGNRGLPDPTWAVRGPEILTELGIHASAQEEYIDEINERYVSLAV